MKERRWGNLKKAVTRGKSRAPRLFFRFFYAIIDKNAYKERKIA